MTDMRDRIAEAIDRARHAEVKAEQLEDEAQQLERDRDQLLFELDVARSELEKVRMDQAERRSILRSAATGTSDADGAQDIPAIVETTIEWGVCDPQTGQLLSAAVHRGDHGRRSAESHVADHPGLAVVWRRVHSGPWVFAEDGEPNE